MVRFARAYDERVLVRDIPVHSVCEHHFLPFSGVAHVAYLPGERFVGLSKLARVVEHLARRPRSRSGSRATSPSSRGMPALAVLGRSEPGP